MKTLVEQAHHKARQLESAIEEELNRFTAETGLIVTELELRLLDLTDIGSDDRKYGYNIDADIKL